MQEKPDIQVVPLEEKPKGKTFKETLRAEFDRYFPIGKGGAKDALMKAVMDIAETAAQAAFHTGLNRGIAQGRAQAMKEIAEQVDAMEGKGEQEEG